MKLNSNVKVYTIGRRKFEGKIVSFEDDSIMIRDRINGKLYRIPNTSINDIELEEEGDGKESSIQGRVRK